MVSGGLDKDVRAEIVHNVKSGVIQKIQRGIAVLFSRKEIESAMRDGKWLTRKSK